MEASTYLNVFLEKMEQKQLMAKGVCISLELSSVVLNMHIAMKDIAMISIMLFNIYFNIIMMYFRKRIYFFFDKIIY